MRRRKSAGRPRNLEGLNVETLLLCSERADGVPAVVSVYDSSRMRDLNL